MTYTESQIAQAKANYNRAMRYHTLADYEVNVIGLNESERRMDFHNAIIDQIKAGNQEVIREWKLFFLNQEVEKDAKIAASKAKIAASKAASADILEPIKSMRKLGEFGKWLNTSGNPYRKQHFNKKYTQQAVDTFLNTLNSLQCK